MRDKHEIPQSIKLRIKASPLVNVGKLIVPSIYPGFSSASPLVSHMRSNNLERLRTKHPHSCASFGETIWSVKAPCDVRKRDKVRHSNWMATTVIIRKKS